VESGSRWPLPKVVDAVEVIDHHAALAWQWLRTPPDAT
jgi:hypothetical protein